MKTRDSFPTKVPLLLLVAHYVTTDRSVSIGTLILFIISRVLGQVVNRQGHVQSVKSTLQFIDLMTWYFLIIALSAPDDVCVCSCNLVGHWLNICDWRELSLPHVDGNPQKVKIRDVVLTVKNCPRLEEFLELCNSRCSHKTGET